MTTLTADHPAAKDIYSDAGRIIRDLEYKRYSIWGFIVYCCTYGEDDEWDRFKKTLTELIRGQVLKSEAPELNEDLKVTFLEDKELFDGASIVSLRQHFHDWVQQNWQREQPRGRDSRDFRYQHFFRVDRASLESVLGYPGSRDSSTMWVDAGHVDFAEASWCSVLDDDDYEDLEEDLQPDLSFEPIEGYTEEDVGWMKVPADLMNLRMYSLFGEASLWPKVYKRPPEIAYWC